MAFLDFRSTWSDLLRELHDGDRSAQSRDTAERVIEQVTSELGLVEPDLMVVAKFQTRPHGRVVYDKFAAHRR